MKKLISIISVVFCIVIIFNACSVNNSLDKTTTTTSNTTTTTTSNTTTTTTTTTTTATTESIINYPTVDEYMESFDSKYGQYVNYTKETNTSSNSVIINWTVDYNPSVSIDYSVSLLLNDDNRVTWCSVTVLHEKFYNCFKDLLSSQYQYDVMVETIMAPYLLACLHNGQDYNDDEFGDLVTDVSKAILVNGRKYDGKVLDCEYYVNLDDETGITSMLDYGGKTHN